MKRSVQMAVITFLMTLVALGVFQGTAAAESACISLQGGAKAACNACEAEGSTFSNFKCIKAAAKPTPDPVVQRDSKPKPQQTAKADPVGVECKLGTKAGRNKFCASCADKNASLNDVVGLCGCNSGFEAQGGTCVAALACVEPQVPVNGACGCKDILAEGPQCTCIAGAVRLTVGAETFCAKFDPAYATLDDLKNVNVNHPERFVALGLAILALVLLFFVSKKNDELQGKVNEILAKGDLAKLEELRKQLRQLEAEYDNAAANAKGKSEAVEKAKGEITKIRGEITRLRDNSKLDNAVKDALTRARTTKESLEDELGDREADAEAASKAKAEVYGQVMATRAQIVALEKKLADLGVATTEKKKSSAAPKAEDDDDGDGERGVKA